MLAIEYLLRRRLVLRQNKQITVEHYRADYVIGNVALLDTVLIYPDLFDLVVRLGLVAEILRRKLVQRALAVNVQYAPYHIYIKSVFVVKLDFVGVVVIGIK